MEYHASNIRNIVLLGHTGSGKTQLAETMLFESGAINRIGSIQEGTTVSDYDPMEIEKKKSLFSSVMSLDWRGYRINLIDTPGTPDFFGELVGAVKVAATAVVVVNAEYGVEVGTENHWNYIEQDLTPTIFVVNKLDAVNANFDDAVAQLKELAGREAIVVQYPMEEGENFHKIVDVLKMTVYNFSKEGGKPTKEPIPENEKEKANKLHNELIELIAENDEGLMNLYFEKGELDEDEMKLGLRKSMVNHQVFPIFCASAQHNMGSGRIMGFIDNVAPSPLDRSAVELANGDKLEIDEKGDFVGFLFKNHAEAHLGDLTYLKVYSGSLKPGDDIVDLATGTQSRISTLYKTIGKKREEVVQLYAGDIGATVKLKDIHVSDTIGLKKSDTIIKRMVYPQPINRTALKINKQGEEEKLSIALHQLEKEDPSLVVEHSQELKQLILYTQGEEHLQRTLQDIETRFKVSCETIDAKIPFRETIQASARAQYRHKKQSGGAGQFADVSIFIEPFYEGMPEPPAEFNVRSTEQIELKWGGKLVFCNCIVGGVIDNRFIPSVIKGIMEKMESGPMTGNYARDIRVCLFDGSMHSVDSNDAAFKTAASHAFVDAFKQAKPQLLEPIYDVSIILPGDFTGSVVSDLSTRRAQIQGMDAQESMQVIKALVPLVEIQRYSRQLQSLTQGRASLSMKYHAYQAVPKAVEQQFLSVELA